jgi:hypothetical protein
MSIVEAWMQDQQTGRPAIGRLILITTLSSIGVVLSAWQAYEIAISMLGVPRLADPLPIRLLAMTAVLYVVVLLGILAIGGLWQLSNFSRRAGIFVASGGELHKGSELQLSLRVATFKALIEALALDVPAHELNDRFLQVGREAGRGFAARIGTIHDTVATAGEAWAGMRDEERMRWWTSYDRTSGLGLISTVARTNAIIVEIQHDALFSRDDLHPKSGEAIANMLGGYCETVLNGILRRAAVVIEPGSIQILPRSTSYVFQRRDTHLD